MNPAISISLAMFRGFPWKRCSVYIVIQLLAAFTGGGLAYCLYHDAILQVDPTLTETYSSWFTVPQTWASPASAFFSEFLAAAVVMVAVLSLGDDQNNPPGAGMHAFVSTPAPIRHPHAHLAASLHTSPNPLCFTMALPAISIRYPCETCTIGD